MFSFVVSIYKDMTGGNWITIDSATALICKALVYSPPFDNIRKRNKMSLFLSFQMDNVKNICGLRQTSGPTNNLHLKLVFIKFCL